MRRMWALVGLAVFSSAAWVARSGPVERDEEEIKMQDVPAAAREALIKHANKATIRAVDRVREDGETSYEAELETAGAKTYIRVTPEGALAEVDESIDLQWLPAAVKRAAEKKFGRIDNCTYEKNTYVRYTIKGEIKGKIVEFEFTPGGKIENEEETAGLKSANAPSE